jgi:hypothetical protein
MTKMIVIPSVSIYFDELDKRYIVQPAVPSSMGGSREFGEPLVISPQDFDSTITDIVLGSLENYLKTRFDPALEPRRSTKQQLDFAKRHKWVCVARLPSGQLRVSAGERHGGSYHGVKDGDIVLEDRSVRENLAHTIREAFRKAK